LGSMRTGLSNSAFGGSADFERAMPVRLADLTLLRHPFYYVY
jgi:hypothetical protein